MTTVLLLLLSVMIVLSGALLFTNGVEWLGAKLDLGQGAVGSLLAAVATALPETLIPVTAIVRDPAFTRTPIPQRSPPNRPSPPPDNPKASSRKQTESDPRPRAYEGCRAPTSCAIAGTECGRFILGWVGSTARGARSSRHGKRHGMRSAATLGAVAMPPVASTSLSSARACSPIAATTSGRSSNLARSAGVDRLRTYASSMISTNGLPCLCSRRTYRSRCCSRSVVANTNANGLLRLNETRTASPFHRSSASACRQGGRRRRVPAPQRAEAGCPLRCAPNVAAVCVGDHRL